MKYVAKTAILDDIASSLPQALHVLVRTNFRISIACAVSDEMPPKQKQRYSSPKAEAREGCSLVLIKFRESDTHPRHINSAATTIVHFLPPIRALSFSPSHSDTYSFKAFTATPSTVALRTLLYTFTSSIENRSVSAGVPLNILGVTEPQAPKSFKIRSPRLKLFSPVDKRSNSGCSVFQDQNIGWSGGYAESFQGSSADVKPCHPSPSIDSLDSTLPFPDKAVHALSDLHKVLFSVTSQSQSHRSESLIVSRASRIAQESVADQSSCQT